MASKSIPAPFDPTSFPIDDVRVPWGKTLAEVEVLLAHRLRWPPFLSAWPSLRGPCSSVFGLAAAEYEIDAPAPHKPVLRVSYELAPPPGHDGTRALPPLYWVQPLLELLGPPEEATDLHRVQPDTPAARAGSVTDSVRWEKWPLRVGLSVFGAVRIDPSSGPAGAGLFLNWLDLIGISGPYRAAAQAQADLLAEAAPRATRVQRFETQAELEPCHTPDYDLPEAHAVRHDETLRKAQRSLEREGLCDTPDLFAGTLSERDVLLWEVPGQAAWCVSTKWDTVLVPPVQKAPHPLRIELWTLIPAKGRGSVNLVVGDFSLVDTYGSPALGLLADALEAAGFAVARTEEPDC